MNKKSEPRGRAFWPVMGLLLALSSGALAWVFTPSVLSFLKSNLRNFPPITSTLSLIVTVILFFLFVMIGSLLVAIAMPRRKSQVTEVQMAKDRDVMVREKNARRIRQRDINRQGRAR